MFWPSPIFFDYKKKYFDKKKEKKGTPPIQSILAPLQFIFVLNAKKKFDRQKIKKIKKKIGPPWKKLFGPPSFFFFRPQKNVFDCQKIKIKILDPLQLFFDRQKKMLLVLLFASVKRFRVSCVRDFLKSIIHLFYSYSYSNHLTNENSIEISYNTTAQI